MATRKSDYTESSIRVLKGLEPVKQRPGMYTRTENPLHVVQEVIDNAADKASGGAYSFSGGLHGVGVSVTNALSTRLEVTVFRDGAAHEIAFAGGDVVQRLKSRALAKGEPKSGTRVRVWPDPRYFDSQALPMADIVDMRLPEQHRHDRHQRHDH